MKIQPVVVTWVVPCRGEPGQNGGYRSISRSYRHYGAGIRMLQWLAALGVPGMLETYDGRVVENGPYTSWRSGRT